MTQPRAIGDYGLIGDGNTAALVSRHGRLAWLCWPRFDSRAIFASLLGDEDNGMWDIAPAGRRVCTRRYRPDTLILETHFRTQSGEVLLTDFMPYQTPSQALVRRVQCLSGRVAMTSRFAPRLNCGADPPRYRRQAGRLLISGADISFGLQATHPELLRAEEPIGFEVTNGDAVVFVLAADPIADVAAYASRSAQACARFWRQWSQLCTYNGPWRSHVVRSLITLKALIHAPSGGIVAAPTASLPERMGGHRNWDYRYCWLRDSTFTVLALLHAGYREEADAWVKWLLRAIAPQEKRARIFYGVVPHTEIDEFEATWLAGFNGSRPVRFGNDARHQLQLGVYGEVQDTLHQWRLVTGNREPRGWASQCTMLDRLQSLVGEADCGIWEQRGHTEYFTQSRALAWVAFDRAIKTAERFGFESNPAWSACRSRLHSEVCEKGYDDSIGAFSRAYGSRSLDASCLLLAMVGFLPPNDPRLLQTVASIRKHLGSGPFVYRYDATRERDGVGGPEGAFLACSYWLADNLILQRQEDEAAAIFESLLEVGNDLGLYSEEYDVGERILLGNFPQALTHLSLVHTALNLTGAGPAHSRSAIDY